MKTQDRYFFNEDQTEFEVRLESGELAHAIDGTPLIFNVETVHCNACSVPMRNCDRYAKGIYLRGDKRDSNRVSMATEYSFCSPICRDTFWNSSNTTPYAKIDTPATIEAYLCGVCQTETSYTVLVGVGELLYSVRDNHLIKATRDNVVIDDSIVLDTATVPYCSHCQNDRIERHTPAFYYAQPGDMGWQDRWENEQFDRGLVATIYTLDREQFQLWESFPDSTARMRQDRIQGQILFANPVEFNKWWMQGDENGDFDRELRETYKALITTGQ